MENYFTRLAKAALAMQPTVLPRAYLSNNFQAEEILPNSHSSGPHYNQSVANTVQQASFIKDKQPYVKKSDELTVGSEVDSMQHSSKTATVNASKENTTQPSKHSSASNNNFAKKNVLRKKNHKNNPIFNKQSVQINIQETTQPAAPITASSSTDEKTQNPIYKKTSNNQLSQQIEAMLSSHLPAKKIMPSANKLAITGAATDSAKIVTAKMPSARQRFANEAVTNTINSSTKNNNSTLHTGTMDAVSKADINNSSLASHLHQPEWLLQKQLQAETIEAVSEPDANISPLVGHLPQPELMAQKQPLLAEKKVKINIMIGRLQIRGKQPVSKKAQASTAKISLTQYLERQTKEVDSHE